MPNIWQLQSNGDVDALSEALRHPDAGTRRGAAAALRALGAWQAVPALQAALAAESDWQVHAAITAAIQYLDHDIHIETLIKNRDVRGLCKMLHSSRHDDVVTACRALGALGDRQAVEPLFMVFRNPLLSDRVRLAAAEALLKLASAPAVVTLLGALRREDWQVRRNAAAVLGQIQATWATDPLIKALQDPHPAVRRTALAALRRIRTQAALSAAQAFEEAQLEAQDVTSPDLEPAAFPQEAPSAVPSAPYLTTPQESTASPEGPPPPRKRKQTDRLPPLPETPEPETSTKPMIRQLEATGGLPKTGRLPNLPAAPPPDAGKAPETDSTPESESTPSQRNGE